MDNGEKMRILTTLEKPLGRLFKHGPRLEFQVTAHVTPGESVGRDELEAATEEALDLLLERAADTALGPAAGCDFEKNCIEIVFSVEATSAEDLHRQVGNVMRLLEHGPFELHDSTTSRIDPDREPALV